MENWSEDGQIFWLDSYGWGLTEDLCTIRLGKEDKVLKFLETGESDLSPDSLEYKTLVQIREYREENGFGKPDIGTTSVERASPMRPTRYRKENIKSIKTRQRASIHKVNR